MQLAEKWESTTEVLCHHQLDLSDYLSFCYFFPIFEGWGLMQLAEKWESTTEVLCHHQLDLSDYLSFCYFFPIFEGWGLMQLAEKWESTTEVLCHHQLDLSDYLSFCYFFPIFEGWGLMQLAEKWESTTEVLCHHQLDLSDSRSWGCIYTWRRRVGVGPSLRFWDPNLDPLTYHTGMGFAFQSTPLVAWHRHHISKASMFMLYNTAMFDPLFLGTFIPQMSKKTTTRFSATDIKLTSLLDKVLVASHTSSTAQGGGGSFKNRKRIGEIDCCEWRMSKQKHWPTD